tara:strand:+ start:873 stop:1805 length:933 start_codon:yes stop_codon:yes gene_type:complete
MTERSRFETSPPRLSGLWLPLITPFLDGRLDEASLARLVAHYALQPIDGLILAATTGEALTLDFAETERLVDVAAETSGGGLPLYLGLAGSDTRALLRWLDQTADWPVDGYLISCPHYSRPSQEGLYRHFTALAGATARPILLYNIPYRTGVNLSNETLLHLAEQSNIVGLKDCCADAQQSFDLLCARPSDFAVLTGEDALFHAALAQGADGGILASAHVETTRFAAVLAAMRENDLHRALRLWRELIAVPRLLFSEPSPAALKHWLWRQGLIASPEVRLPMTGVTAGLAALLDAELAARGLQQGRGRAA